MTPVDQLYPPPRDKRALAGGGVLKDVLRTPIARVPLDRPGSYTIAFDGRALAATAADDDGEHSARSALRQLAANEGSECPGFEIGDWPRFATRGFMLDVSRNRVPTMQTLRELIDTLSALRMNHLQLYTEHTFAYRGHEGVWRDASPMTADEIRALEALCRERGITLAANQNCFGHLAEWLSRPEYAHLAETHGPYNFYGLTRSGPFSLCPVDERSLSLVSDWIGQLRECFTSPLINVGCDETADVGVGRSKQAVAERGKGAVYAAFVASVARLAEEQGFQPMFWADIALGSPGTLEMLPASLQPLAWGYEPDSPFDEWNTALRSAGRVGWVCPGTACWRTFGGRTAERRATLDAACTERAGFDGVLITAWGDVGHQQQWPITLHALGDAAHAAWHGTANTDPGAASRLLFGSRALGPWLDELGDADRELRSRSGFAGPGPDRTELKNASAVFNELFPANPALPRRGSVSQWRACRDRLEELERCMPSADPPISDELRWTIAASRFACDLAVARRASHTSDVPASRLASITDDFHALWERRSRPGGLDRSLDLLKGVAETLAGASR